MSHTRERYFELTLLGLIFVLGGILFYQAQPFLNGALGAITLYILLRRVNFYLIRKTSDSWAPWIITFVTFLFVLIPMSLGVWYIVNLIQNQGMHIDFHAIIDRFNTFVTNIEERTGLDLISEKSLSFITTQCTNIARMMMAGINNFAINCFTALLLLFFLLAGGMKMELYISRLLPFSEHNKRLIVSRIGSIVRSNAIGIPLLALIQGGVAVACYLFCGIKNPIEFGVLTGFASMIPIVGTMLVWVPLAISQYFSHGFIDAMPIALCGLLIISQCDNVLRMIMQRRMANTHPLITIFGVVAGLPIFGFMGLIFGPLLVAMFLLFLDLFAHQYIEDDKDNSASQAPQAPTGSRSNRFLKKQNRSSVEKSAVVHAIPSLRTRFKNILSKASLRKKTTAAQASETQALDSDASTAKGRFEKPNTHSAAALRKNSTARFEKNKNGKAENKERKRNAAREQNSKDLHLRDPKNARSTVKRQQKDRNASFAQKTKSANPRPVVEAAPVAHAQNNNVIAQKNHQNLISRAVSEALRSCESSPSEPFSAIAQAKADTSTDRSFSAAASTSNNSDEHSSQQSRRRRDSRHEKTNNQRSRNQKTSDPKADKASTHEQTERTSAHKEQSSRDATAARHQRSTNKNTRKDKENIQKKRRPTDTGVKEQNSRSHTKKSRHTSSYQQNASGHNHQGHSHAASFKEETPFLHTVVSSQYGNQRHQHKEKSNPIKTELISMYTVKGTVQAQQPQQHRRHPSRKRPYHH